MKSLQVIFGLQKAAGTSVFCAEVANGLAEAGHEVTVAVIEPGKEDGYPLDKRVKVISIESLLDNRSVNEFEVVHIHALWTPVLHRVSEWAHKNKIPVVWSTHGMTAPWSMRHKWWKKVPAWWLYQRRDLRGAAAIHCTTEQEVEWNQKLGFRHCVVVPLGTNSKPGHHVAAEHKTLLFVGRIYPVKAIDRLIKAFGMVKEDFRKNWRLRIVGPDQAGHQAMLAKMVRELRVSGSVEFAGPKFGNELDAEYDKCDCLALVSHTENFGATIVDAMAHGKPVIAGDKTPWREVSERKCGWWVSNEPEQLSFTIATMMTMSDLERCDMGARGRKLVEEKYTWGAVATKMIEGYEEVINARA